MFQLIANTHHGRKHYHVIVEARAAVLAVGFSIICVGIGLGFVMEGRMYQRLPDRIMALYMKDLPEKVALLETQLRANSETCDELRTDNVKLAATASTMAVEHQKQEEANDWLREHQMPPTNKSEGASGGM